MKRSRICLVAVLALFAAATSGSAQDTPRLDEPVQAHPEGDAAIKSLKSPFCPGLMLEVCPSPQAKLLRDTIQAMAHAGATSDSLVAWMLASYGEEYRAVPRARGGGLWAWTMPPLVLLTGFLFVILALRHFRSRREATVPVEAPLSQEDESVLAAALRELKATEEVSF